jgi:hypothetical protein
MATLILNSGRCSHGRCFFCGYGRIRGFEPTEKNVNECLDRFFAEMDDDEVKVFGSGSFLDEKQIPKAARTHFIQMCKRKGVKKVTVESRPEFVDESVLAEFKGFELTVAMGLETADEGILKKLNKGYGRKEYEQAAAKIHEAGFKARTYLLVNPPFVTDVRRDIEQSVEYALKHSDTVVLINMLPHANAPLAKLWVNGEWNFLSKTDFLDVVNRWNKNPRIEFDQETYRFTPSFPDDMREGLKGVGEWYLTHPHFEVWQDYLLRWYNPPEGRILLFLPCANRKPYSLSMTHQGIIRVMNEIGRNRFHEVMLSNAGIIPREFEEKYPFESYDWDESLETPKIKERYIDVTAERIEKYLAAHSGRYESVACFLKYDSESYKALEKACKELDIRFKNLLTKETYDKIRNEPRPMQSEQALADLREGLRWCLRNST